MDDNSHFAVDTSDTSIVNSLRGQRPPGVALLALLNLTNGVFIAGHRLLMLADVYLSPGGPIAFSGPFEVKLVSELLISLVAIVSGVGLFVGAKWGWWLGAFHWSWHICREVVYPVAATFLANQSFDSMSGDNLQISRVTGSAVIQSLILLYMFRANVLNYFGLGSLRKLWALLKVFGAGFLLSIVLYLLNRTGILHK